MEGCLELVASPRRTRFGGAFSAMLAATGKRGAMSITIYHNPRCGKSRQTLALLRERGIEPKIVEYLATPPSEAELKRLLAMLGLAPRQLLRAKEAKEAGIDPAKLSDAALIAAMVKHPIVIERPIVVHGTKAALGRPPEAVVAIL
jgi:arsenate reductase (glutaredoxin)